MSVVRVLPGGRGVPPELRIPDKPAHRGGEANVYFSTDDRYVVKIYHRSRTGHNQKTDKQERLQLIIDLGRNLGSDERYLAWPLAIVTHKDGAPTIGVVTRKAPSTHIPLYKLIHNPMSAVQQYKQGRSWLEYLKMARGMVAAIRTIHGKGIAHGDIQPKNVLADPKTGEVALIDLDGLVVRGFLKGDVAGTPGSMAPEILSGQAQPSELTDRHSTAILILWTLLLRNVLQTQICYDPDDQVNDDRLGYGKYASFSEAPGSPNWIPLIGTPLFRNGQISYKDLPPQIQKLTEGALVHYLHTQVANRPKVYEWEWALADAYDLFTPCPNCRQSYFYQYWIQPQSRRRCPFCGAPSRQPAPAVVELLEERGQGEYVPARRVVLYHGLPIFEDHAISKMMPPFTRKGTPILGGVVWDKSQSGYRLVNNSNMPWKIIAGGSGVVSRGNSLALKKGVLFSLGSGRRLVRVLE